MSNKDISKAEYKAHGYIQSFRKHEDTWFCQASLIVDKRLNDDEKPFVFQSVSLPVYGTPKKLLDSYQSPEGALIGFDVGEPGKKRAFLFRIHGYRAEATGNPDYPIEIKGRILSIDEKDNF